MSNETYIYQTRPMHIKRDLYITKETHSHQNRPVKKSKETHVRIKRVEYNKPMYKS